MKERIDENMEREQTFLCRLSGLSKQEELLNICNIYKLIQEITYDILLDFYQDKSKIQFPIDIRGIIEKYHIHVVETDLNEKNSFFIERVNGCLKKIENQEDVGSFWRIYIEETDSEFTKRYILAHEFGHYILEHYPEERNAAETGIQHCVDPMFPKKWNELFSDIFAAYLLCPYDRVAELIDSHIEKLKKKEERPMEAVELLRMIGNKAQISSYHVFICYQYIRYYMCYLYNKGLEDRSHEEEAIIDKIGYLFK